MKDEPAVEVTAAIIRRGHEVLITRRPPGGRHPGCWEFPGGKLEPGETLEECLAREIAEEMGVEVEVGDLLARTRHSYLDLTVALTAYECELPVGVEPRDIGCSEHRWVEPVTLGEYDLLPPDRLLAARIFRRQ